MTSQFGHGNVIVIPDDTNFQPEIERAGDRLVVVDFTASWCGPCQSIAPIFVELSMKYPMAVFLKVDVDQCEMTAALNGIRAMPTFQFFKKKSKVDEITGANPITLESKIKQWIGTSTNNIVVDPRLVAAGRSFDCFDLLLDNSPVEFMNASEILIKFANNIINYPTNPKYRNIRVSNKTFQLKLLPVAGGVECLFTMGFEEQGDNLVMPTSMPLENLRALRDALHDERTRQNEAACSVGNMLQQAPVAPPPQAQSPSYSSSQTVHSDIPQDFMHKEKLFYRKMKGSADHVMFYEDPDLQRRARALIPIVELEKKAKEMNEGSKEAGSGGVDEKDCLLLALLTWYKVSGFFQWMDKPKCGRCNVEGQSCGYLPPTPEEERWGAGRVEGYICPRCGQDMRFPRYNHPGKLLETRCGRCGEWANIFTLFCRAMGFEARYVLDWTDHVWTEVYSVAQKRWLHVDACEGICDKPLIYEAGWNKKLTYIIAFSKDEIVDVTWRYSAKHEEVRQRRTECSEDWLFGQISMMTTERQKNLPPERKQELQMRFVTEMVDFMSLKSAKDDELQGRTSGSMKWRQLRGEAGAQPANKHVPYVFQPTDKEVEAKRFRLRYCCASDKYYRALEDEIPNCGKAAVDGCMAGMASVQSVFRKVEHDWKMVYLARLKNTLSGTVSWKIDFTKCGLVVDSVTVKAWSNTFENGQVLWKLAGDKQDSPLLVFGGGKETTTTSSLSGSKTFTLTADLSGGKGDVAWQHAQLFRQSIDSYMEYPLDILVTLKEP